LGSVNTLDSKGRGRGGGKGKKKRRTVPRGNEGVALPLPWKKGGKKRRVEKKGGGKKLFVGLPTWAGAGFQAAKEEEGKRTCFGCRRQGTRGRGKMAARYFGSIYQATDSLSVNDEAENHPPEPGIRGGGGKEREKRLVMNLGEGD